MSEVWPIGPAPAIGYGAANIGNLHRPLTDEESRAVLEEAWRCGIRYFDTAPHYGLGLSEIRLGEFLRTKPRAQYRISTKVGRLLRPSGPGTRPDLAEGFAVDSGLARAWDFSPEGIRRSVEESLTRTGLDRFDVLYLHDPERHDLDLGIRSALPELVRLRSSGAVDAVGVGSMDTLALDACARSGLVDVLMVAGRYTLLEQPAADVVAECARRGIDVVAASVFNSGLLASSRPDRGGRYEYGDLPAEMGRQLDAIVEICDRHAVPLPVAAVQFPARASAVRSVVIGASRPEQIRQCAEWAAWTVPDEFWWDMDLALRAVENERE